MKDQHKEVQDLHAKGFSIRDIAQITGLSKSSVGRLLQKLQQPVTGTASGTPAGTVPGPVSQTVPGTGKTASGTENSEESSEKEAASALQQTKDDSSGFRDAIVRLHIKEMLQESYRIVLRNTAKLLNSNLGSEEKALSQMIKRREEVGEFIRMAELLCNNECRVNYKELFMAYALEQLYVFLGQPTALVRTNDELKIMENPSIQLLLEKAFKQDIFTSRQGNYIGYPPHFNQHAA